MHRANPQAMDRQHRHSIRLEGYDYSREGAYFITVCTHHRSCLFGSISDPHMIPNDLGKITISEWLKTVRLRPNVCLDEYALMPNHLHGIVVIMNQASVSPIDIGRRSFQSPSQTIGAIVRGWKAAVTRRINDLRGTPGTPVWQRNYYEHVIRNEQDMADVRAYIVNNPALWAQDQEDPNLMMSARR